MRFLSILVALGLHVTAAFGQADTAAVTTPVEPLGLEPVGTVPAERFVPPHLMQGSLHTIRPLASNDGLLNTYFVETAGELVAVTGSGALVTYLRELYAIDYLQGLSRTDAFAKAVGQAGKAKLGSVAGMARDPIGTIKSVPKGASRFFGRVGEGIKGAREGDSAAVGEGAVLAKIAGTNKVKARLAADLGVNPFTTNEALQRQLTEVARAMAGGGLVVNAATSAVAGPAGTVLSVAGATKVLQDTLITSTPEDLRAANRKQLQALGVDRALADEFLMHPWFNPWHETIITTALTEIGVNPSAFLTCATRALTSEDADYFQRTAQILARYQAKTAPLRSIRIESGIVAALDGDGTLVIPVSLDYGTWSERAARRLDEITAASPGAMGARKLALWTDGQLSERLCAELKARTISFRAAALSDQ